MEIINFETGRLPRGSAIQARCKRGFSCYPRIQVSAIFYSASAQVKSY